MPTAPLTHSLACVTVSCPESAQLETLLRDVLGWERAGAGSIDADLERLWGIASGSAASRFSLWRSPGAEWGMIRVVQGPDRYPTRQIGAPLARARKNVSHACPTWWFRIEGR